MKYFSENKMHINAECEKCGKVLKIKRERCLAIGSLYKIDPAVKCFCGNISNEILKKAADNIPKCPTCGSTNIQKISASNKVGKAVLFGIFAIGSMGKTFKCNKCGHRW